jgi:hypothetical protein
LGAGATKACGGPLTNEILPDAFASRDKLGRADHIDRLEAFLVENFNLREGERTADDFPPLPLLLSLVDTAIDRDDVFAPGWPPAKLRAVRDALEYAIFALLEYRLRSIERHHTQFFEALYATRSRENVKILSLNYDIIADNALPKIARDHNAFGLPDYGCDIATTAYRETEKFGTLLKLHGSLNWLYCPNCHRLDLGIAESGYRTMKMLNAVYGGPNLHYRYESGAMPCPDCKTPLRPILITPTHLKDYRNPHIARVWYESARALREATQAIFVGYSMPEDDVDVIYLFKRGLSHLKRGEISVVEYARGRSSTLGAHPVGRRYRALFGDDVEWWPRGFADWVSKRSADGFAPRRAGRPVRRATAPRATAPRTRARAAAGPTPPARKPN